MLNKVYILGKIPSYIDKKTKNQYTLAKNHLLKIGFKNVINPIENFKNNDGLSQETKKLNLKLLLECDTVYVLPSTVYDKAKNVELAIAIELNLITIHGTIMVTRKKLKNER